MPLGKACLHLVPVAVRVELSSQPLSTKGRWWFPSRKNRVMLADKERVDAKQIKPSQTEKAGL